MNRLLYPISKATPFVCRKDKNDALLQPSLLTVLQHFPISRRGYCTRTNAHHYSSPTHTRTHTPLYIYKFFTSMWTLRIHAYFPVVFFFFLSLRLHPHFLLLLHGLYFTSLLCFFHFRSLILLILFAIFRGFVW